MTVNLLPWRRTLHQRRKRSLVLAAVLVLMLALIALGASEWRLSAKVACWRQEAQYRGVRTQRLQALGASLWRDSLPDGNLLDQMRSFETGGKGSISNHASWLRWVKRSLDRQQLRLGGWLVSAENLDIRFQVYGGETMSTLTSLIDETGWRMAEINANGEAINVVIKVSAMD